MYILRQINTRLSILEDYLYNTPGLSDAEKSRWGNLANQYRELRVELAKKNVAAKKAYGIFIDYEKLDNL